MVGDYKYDVIAGRDAGCRTALVLTPVPADLDDWGKPDLAVPSLRALAAAWWPGAPAAALPTPPRG